MLKISKWFLLQNRHFLRNESKVGWCTSKSCFSQGKQNNSNSNLFKGSVSVESSPENRVEITSVINQRDIRKLLNTFRQREVRRRFCIEHGIDSEYNPFEKKNHAKYLTKNTYLSDLMFDKIHRSFSAYCRIQTNELPSEMRLKMSDIVNGSAPPTDLFPYFLNHAHELYPHLTCIDQLKDYCDLRGPFTWYPQARRRKRKIIFHAGPTNSGKTYCAMQRFLESKSGIYCGPLRLLAVEVFQKSNNKGKYCDLLTGEERRRGNPDGSKAKHLASTIEMAPISRKCMFNEIEFYLLE